MSVASDQVVTNTLRMKHARIKHLFERVGDKLEQVC